MTLKEILFIIIGGTIVNYVIIFHTGITPFWKGFIFGVIVGGVVQWIYSYIHPKSVEYR